MTTYQLESGWYAHSGDEWVGPWGSEALAVHHAERAERDQANRKHIRRVVRLAERMNSLAPLPFGPRASRRAEYLERARASIVAGSLDTAKYWIDRAREA